MNKTQLGKWQASKNEKKMTGKIRIVKLPLDSGKMSCKEMENQLLKSEMRSTKNKSRRDKSKQNTMYVKSEKSLRIHSKNDARQEMVLELKRGTM